MNAYLNAIWPEPFTVLGKRLRPLSIGRLLLLQRFETLPIDDPGKLILAVIICSRHCREVSGVLEDRWLDLKIQIWRWRLGRIDWPAKFKLFNDYLAAYCKRPGVYESNGSPGPPPGAPWLQHIRVTLLAFCHWTIAEVEETGYSQALWDYWTFWELKGQALIKPEEAEADASVRERMHAEANAHHEERLKKANAMLHGL